MDLSGRHQLGRFPTDRAEAWPRRAQYFLIASYRIFSPLDETKRKSDEQFAKEMTGSSGVTTLGDSSDGLAIMPEGVGSAGKEEEYSSRVLYFARFL